MADRVETAMHSRTGARPHDYDPALGGYCSCGLVQANALHDEAAIAAWRQQLHAAQQRVHDAQDAHRARTGER